MQAFVDNKKTAAESQTWCNRRFQLTAHRAEPVMDDVDALRINAGCGGRGC